MDLLATLKEAQEDTCSLHCPSVWTTGQRPPHSEKCQRISAAIAEIETQQNVALIADVVVNFDEKLNDLLDALQAYFNKYGVGGKNEDIANAMADVCMALEFRGTPPR